MFFNSKYKFENVEQIKKEENSLEIKKPDSVYE